MFFAHDVDRAAGTAVPAGRRAKPSPPPHPARAEIWFGSTQGFKGFATVHAAKHSTKSRSAGETGAFVAALLPGFAAAVGGPPQPIPPQTRPFDTPAHTKARCDRHGRS